MKTEYMTQIRKADGWCPATRWTSKKESRRVYRHYDRFFNAKALGHKGYRILKRTTETIEEVAK